VAATRVVSAGSLMATLTVPSVAALSGTSSAVTAGAAIAAAVIAWRHRGNLARIRAGTERRLRRAAEKSDA
jgi:glycerol-3-phosphate acyltransferase PlsY